MRKFATVLFALMSILCGTLSAAENILIIGGTNVGSEGGTAFTNIRGYITTQISAGNDGFTKLLLHCDGTDGSTNFLDSSTNAVSVIAVGSAQIDIDQKKFGTAAGLFDGNADYLSLASSSDWNYGAGAFTIDFWIMLKILNTAFSAWSHGGSNMPEGTGGVISWSAVNNRMEYYCSGNRIQSTTVFATNIWYHVALVGNGGAEGARTIKLYLNGAQEGGTYTNNYSFSTTIFWVGANQDASSQCLPGWIDEFRVSKGVERWTTDFQPPEYSYGE